MAKSKIGKKKETHKQPEKPKRPKDTKSVINAGNKTSEKKATVKRDQHFSFITRQILVLYLKEVRQRYGPAKAAVEDARSPRSVANNKIKAVISGIVCVALLVAVYFLIEDRIQSIVLTLVFIGVMAIFFGSLSAIFDISSKFVELYSKGMFIMIYQNKPSSPTKHGLKIGFHYVPYNSLEVIQRDDDNSLIVIGKGETFDIICKVPASLNVRFRELVEEFDPDYYNEIYSEY